MKMTASNTDGVYGPYPGAKEIQLEGTEVECSSIVP